MVNTIRDASQNSILSQSSRCSSLRDPCGYQVLLPAGLVVGWSAFAYDMLAPDTTGPESRRDTATKFRLKSGFASLREN